MEHPENDSAYAGLQVNAGVSEAPTVNPYFRYQRKKTRHTAQEYFEGIRRGDISLLGQAVTLVESALPADHDLAQEVIQLCLPYAGNATRLGITGVPGAGKSTFIEALGMKLVREGHKLAVLAIDPSSELTKGSILGDKTRMEQLSTSDKAFIRPSPSAGSLGGVARKTRETIVLCEAAGFDTVFVETVGVGQSETAVHSMVDFFLLLQVAGTGDELQGIKRGIMEMADGISINKCDGSNVERAQLARVQFNNALQLFPAHVSGWKPYALTMSSVDNTGIDQVWKMVEDYVKFTLQNGYFNRKRTEQAKYWMYESINEQLRNHFYQDEQLQPMIADCERKVLNDEMSSFVAAATLLNAYWKNANK